MFFTKLFNNVYRNVERRCAENKNDLMTTARFYIALTNLR